MNHVIDSLKQLLSKPAWSDLGYLVAYDAEPRMVAPRESVEDSRRFAISAVD